MPRWPGRGNIYRSGVTWVRLPLPVAIYGAMRDVAAEAAMADLRKAHPSPSWEQRGSKVDFMRSRVETRIKETMAAEAAPAPPAAPPPPPLPPPGPQGPGAAPPDR